MTTSTPAISAELEPVFLELGKALYICQAFEGTLVLLLSLISYEEASQDEAFTSAVDIYSQKTLGQLLKRLAEKIEIPAEVQAHLTQAWERRNVIVHRFVHDHISAMLEPKGRIELEALLVKYKQEIKLADVVANRLLDLYLGKHGLTVEALKENADRLWKYLNPISEEASVRH